MTSPPPRGQPARGVALAPVVATGRSLAGRLHGVAPASDRASHAAKLSGRRLHRIAAGAGHNLLQEALPHAFAAAVVEIDRYGPG